MEWLLDHIYDIITLSILPVGIIYGHKKGIVRMIISIVGIAAAFFAATFISNITYEYVYMKAVQPTVISVIQSKADELMENYDPEEKMKELLSDKGYSEEDTSAIFDSGDEDKILSLLTGDEFRGTLNNVFTEYCTKLTESLSGVLPEEITENAEKYLDNAETDHTEKLDILDASKTSAAAVIEREVIRPILLKTVKSVIFALTFIIVKIAFSVIACFFKALRSISAVKNLDSFFGGVLGLIYSLLIIAAFAILCSAFIRLTGDENPVISTAAISESYLFKYAYSGTFAVISAIKASSDR